MTSATRVLMVATLAALLAGCYQPGVPPDPPTAPGPYVEGHFGQNGFWVPGHYQRGTPGIFSSAE